MLVSILVWSAAGALGGVFGALVYNKTKNNNARIITTVVVMVGLQALMMPFARTWEAERATDQALNSIPMYVSLKKIDPETYSAVRDVMIKGLKSRKNKDELYAESSRILLAKLPKIIRVTSNEAAIEYLAALQVQLRNMYGETCYALLFPATGVENARAVQSMSKADKELALSAMNSVVTAAARAPQAPPPEYETLPGSALVSARLLEHGSDLKLLSRTDLNANEKGKVCEVTKTMVAAIGDLPESERGIVIRSAFGTN